MDDRVGQRVSWLVSRPPRNNQLDRLDSQIVQEELDDSILCYMDGEESKHLNERGRTETETERERETKLSLVTCC